MITLKRTNSEDLDFIELVKLLDADLVDRYGDEQIFYDQFNKITMIKNVIVAYEDHEAIACGAIKQYSPAIMEVKRMYCLPEKRGRGIASNILLELEMWAKELSYEKCILETGVKQEEAIAMYLKNNYLSIPNYGQYIGKDQSVCFEKSLG